jgi:hypothetical protein
MALRDYYLGRFGDCPPRVRSLRQSKTTTWAVSPQTQSWIIFL